MHAYGFEWSYLEPNEYIESRDSKILKVGERAKMEAGKRKNRNGP